MENGVSDDVRYGKNQYNSSNNANINREVYAVYCITHSVTVLHTFMHILSLFLFFIPFDFPLFT